MASSFTCPPVQCACSSSKHLDRGDRRETGKNTGTSVHTFRTRWRYLFPVLPFLVDDCVVASSDNAATSPSAQTGANESDAGDASTLGSTDPVDHLNVIAALCMEGRGTPSDVLDRAAAYVVAECQKAGVAGALPDGAYLQPFTVGGFGLVPSLAAPTRFGNELFEEAIFLGGAATAETKREMGASLCQAWRSLGQTCPDGVVDGRVDPRTLLGEAATAARPANNIVAVLPGTGPHAREVVLVSAHLDHLGKRSDGIYPGADDNGTGSSSLLALMHSLAQSKASLDRTVVFFWTAGEEKGLLGAAYFVDNPPIALANVKQVLNMDMVGAWDDTRFSLGVDSRSEAGAELVEAAGHELGFTSIYRDVQSYNTRQDGYTFSRRQIPTIFLFEGLSNADGGGDLQPNYHQETDTIENLLAENGGSKVRRMVKMLTSSVTKIANAAAL